MDELVLWPCLNYLISLSLSIHIYKLKALHEEFPRYMKSLPYGLSLWFGTGIGENMVPGCDMGLVLEKLKILTKKKKL